MTLQLATKNLQRVHGRGLLLSALEKESILTRVNVFYDGRFTIETKLWNEYWQPVDILNDEKVEEALNKLHIVWHDYIQSKFSISLRQNFCYRYFALLDALLSLRTQFKVQEWLHSLQHILGFECFGITTAIDNKVLAAGTCTLRNPCYLLAKLKMPDVLDDPQFLPVIPVMDIEQPELFYYYRQYTMSPDSLISLLLYPAVSGVKRLDSFKLLNSLVGGVSYGIDPRTRERAQRLYRSIIRSLVEANSLYGETINFELVDIGAGSGSLSAAICREIKNAGLKPRLRLWFVDLEPADPARFFRNKRLRVLADNLTFVGDDYRDWLTRPQPLPVKSGLRVALVSKLFNNLSTFFIHYLSRKQSSPLLESMDDYPCMDIHHPSVCLSPSGTGIKSLAISNTRVQLQEGRAFSQASLSEFNRGLYLLTGAGDLDEPHEAGLFLPIRSFNPDCLVNLNGKSVISILSENCDYIIIEDADLRPQDLIDHATQYSLVSLTIYDMTKTLKLKGNFLYVIWTRKAMNPQFSGEQIW
jgi:hypothetical protein